MIQQIKKTEKALSMLGAAHGSLWVGLWCFSCSFCLSPFSVISMGDFLLDSNNNSNNNYNSKRKFVLDKD